MESTIKHHWFTWTTGRFVFHILPRKKLTREDWLAVAPLNSIALDGAVLGGPFFDARTRRVNFDHHDNVMREATMSTCMQVYFAIKGGLMDMFPPDVEINVFIEDTDQD